jgi:hypothetical protein
VKCEFGDFGDELCKIIAVYMYEIRCAWCGDIVHHRPDWSWAAHGDISSQLWLIERQILIPPGETGGRVTAIEQWQYGQHLIIMIWGQCAFTATTITSHAARIATLPARCELGAASKLTPTA